MADPDAPGISDRERRLREKPNRWMAWAKTATTDHVPDRFKGEPMPDGTIADRPWWYQDDNTLRDYPPKDGPSPFNGHGGA